MALKKKFIINRGNVLCENTKFSVEQELSNMLPWVDLHSLTPLTICMYNVFHSWKSLMSIKYIILISVLKERNKKFLTCTFFLQVKSDVCKILKDSLDAHEKNSFLAIFFIDCWPSLAVCENCLEMVGVGLWMLRLGNGTEVPLFCNVYGKDSVN